MSDHTPVETRNLDRYGSPPLPWSRVHDQLASATLSMDVPFFLSTCGPDGRPHAAGIGPRWLDGDMYFTSGPGTRKSRHLAANPACVLSFRLDGVDVVLEGEAHRVVDPSTLESVAAGFREGGWPAEVDGDAFTAPYSAPSAGPPPWHLFRFSVATAVGVATTEPPGATRWRF
jgi:hypothetical protein